MRSATIAAVAARLFSLRDALNLETPTADERYVRLRSGLHIVDELTAAAGDNGDVNTKGYSLLDAADHAQLLRKGRGVKHTPFEEQQVEECVKAGFAAELVRGAATVVDGADVSTVFLNGAATPTPPGALRAMADGPIVSC